MDNIVLLPWALCVVGVLIYLLLEKEKLTKSVANLQVDLGDISRSVKTNHECCHEHFKTFYNLTGTLRGDYDTQQGIIERLSTNYFDLLEGTQKISGAQQVQDKRLDEQRDTTGRLALNIGRSIEMVSENIDLWVSLLADFTKLQAMGAHIEVDEIEVDCLPHYEAYIMFGNVAFHKAQSACRETAIMRAVEEACAKVDESEA